LKNAHKFIGNEFEHPQDGSTSEVQDVRSI